MTTVILSSATDPGLARSFNEDRVYAKRRDPALGGPLALLIVADGMGGHQAGDRASTMAVETVVAHLNWFLERHEMEDTQRMPIVSGEHMNPTDHLKERLRLAVEAANEAIYAYAQEHAAEAGNMGTTITAVLIQNDQAIVANVGDSRTYHLRSHDGTLSQVTDDHSYVGHLVRMGEIERHEVFDHPRRSLITRALGNKPEVKVDLFVVPLVMGDQLLLCSDGLWEMVHDEGQMRDVLAGRDVGAAATQLIMLANKAGGADNIGIAIAKIGR